MATFQESIAVSAPVGRVWSAVVDFEGRPKHSPRVKEARLLDGGPLREGSRIRLVIDRNAMTPRVQELRPGERLTLLVKGLGFRATHTYEVRPADQGATVSITGAYAGLLGRLVSRLMARSFRRDLAEELAAIKGAAEEGEAR